MTRAHAEPDSKGAAAPSPMKRRGLILGTGVAAVAGVAAAVASRTLQSAEPAPAALATPDPEAEGYRLSQHVLRYYETARV